MTTAASETNDLAFKYLVCVTSYRSEPTGVQIDVAYRQLSSSCSSQDRTGTVPVSWSDQRRAGGANPPGPTSSQAAHGALTLS